MCTHTLQGCWVFIHPFGIDEPTDHPDIRNDAGLVQDSPGMWDSCLMLKPAGKEELWLMAISLHIFSSHTKAEKQVKTAASLGTESKSLSPILAEENHTSIETGIFLNFCSVLVFCAL